MLQVCPPLLRHGAVRQRNWSGFGPNSFAFPAIRCRGTRRRIRLQQKWWPLLDQNRYSLAPLVAVETVLHTAIQRGADASDLLFRRLSVLAVLHRLFGGVTGSCAGFLSFTQCVLQQFVEKETVMDHRFAKIFGTGLPLRAEWRSHDQPDSSQSPGGGPPRELPLSLQNSRQDSHGPS